VKVGRPNSTLKVDTEKPLRRRKSLERKSAPARRTPLKATQPERDWSDARWKVERQGVCRNCGHDWERFPGRRLEAAHTAAREYDRPKPCPVCRGAGELPEAFRDLFGVREPHCPYCAGKGAETPDVLWVDPDDIVPLCGPNADPTTCHGKDHRNQLDLLALLTLPEQLRVVAHLGSIENARVRLAPTQYPVLSPKGREHDEAKRLGL
jgi:hypothetical protein